VQAAYNWVEKRPESAPESGRVGHHFLGRPCGMLTGAQDGRTDEPLGGQLTTMGLQGLSKPLPDVAGFLAPEAIVDRIPVAKRLG